jgi:hypothetical protein
MRNRRARVNGNRAGCAGVGARTIVGGGARIAMGEAIGA